jgi:hypothetical protein
MTVKVNEEKKSPLWLRYFRDLFVDASTRIKQLFTHRRSILPDTGTSNNGHVETPGTYEQKNIAYDSSYLLILPPGIRNKFVKLASESRGINAPLLNHAGNHSTLALLNINNVYFWGVNNAESALSARDSHDLRAILKDQNSISGHSPLLVHPEADAILKAFKQKMTADRATMFVYRKPCNICASREYNAMHLRRLLRILSVRELTVYTTNSMGRITKLVLSPFHQM